MLKVAGGIILAIIILTVVVPVMCGVCVIGGGSALVELGEKEIKREKAEEKTTTVTVSPAASVMYQTSCNVRSRPSTNAHIIGRAVAHTPYSVLEDRGRWKKISINGAEGWTGCQDMTTETEQDKLLRDLEEAKLNALLEAKDRRKRVGSSNQ